MIVADLRPAADDAPEDGRVVVHIPGEGFRQVVGTSVEFGNLVLQAGETQS